MGGVGNGHAYAAVQIDQIGDGIGLGIAGDECKKPAILFDLRVVGRGFGPQDAVDPFVADVDIGVRVSRTSLAQYSSLVTRRPSSGAQGLGWGRGCVLMGEVARGLDGVHAGSSEIPGGGRVGLVGGF